MSDKNKKSVRIELTAEQRAKIQQETGKEASAIEFAAEELEERIAPATFDPTGSL